MDEIKRHGSVATIDALSASHVQKIMQQLIDKTMSLRSGILYTKPPILTSRRYTSGACGLGSERNRKFIHSRSHKG